MTHDQYIRNINYKIDSLFTEYDEISTNINILAINSNHMMLNEGYTPDDIYYENIDYMVEATEAKKGILGKIIDGIIKMIRTIVDKVKSFFSENKPDPKVEVPVAKSLESRTSKLMKLKPTILKGLALVGTVGAGALVASKVAKGRGKGEGIPLHTGDYSLKIDPTDHKLSNPIKNSNISTSNQSARGGEYTTPPKGKANDMSKWGSSLPKDPTSYKLSNPQNKGNISAANLSAHTAEYLHTPGVTPSKISGKASSTMAQSQIYGPTKHIEVDVKSHEELEKIAKEMEATVEAVKEEKKKDSKESKSATTEFKFDSGKIIQHIKDLTGVLTNINKSVSELSNKIDTAKAPDDFRAILGGCNRYATEVTNTVNEMMASLNAGTNNQKELARTITKSSVMHKFDRAKDKTMSNITATKARGMDKIKSQISESMNEFEKVDREKKDPKAKPIFSGLKKLQQVAYSRDKYDNYTDYVKDCVHYREMVEDKVIHTKDLDTDYEKLAYNIIELLNKVYINMK